MNGKAKGKAAPAKRKPTLSPKLKAAGKKEIAKMARRGRSTAAANLKAAKAMKNGAGIDARIAKPNGDTATARTIGQPTLDVAKIKIGKRHRTEFGDISGLTDSINDRGGLLQPIVVTPGHTLIAGERRIRAWAASKFGGQPIPVTVVDVDSIVAGEWDENAQRKDFTPSEAVAIKRALEPLERAKAVARQRAGKAAAGGEKKRATDKVAQFVGMDRKTIAKAEAIVDAAEADPKKFGALKDQMDRTGRVHGPHKRLTNLQQSEAIRKEPPPMPGRGPYRAGVIDPPWASEPDGESPSETGRGYFKYPTMTTAELVAMGPAIRALLHPEGAWIWVWTTNFHLIKRHAFTVLDGWGFEAVHIRTGFKDKHGRGQVMLGSTEHAILCKVGNPPAVNLTNQTTGFDFKVRKDSQKPDNFYADVEALTPAPRYFELFSRRVMPDNWDGHGDQVGLLGADAPPPVEFVSFGNIGQGLLKVLGAIERGDPIDFNENDHVVFGLYTGKKKRKLTKAGRKELERLRQAAEPTLPGIPAAVETPSTVEQPQGADRHLDQAQPENIIPMLRAADVRGEIDAKVTASKHVEVRINSHLALYVAFDKISHDTGAGSGYPAYPVPLNGAADISELAADLDAINGALATLSPDELEEFAIGEQSAAAAIAARSDHLARAHGLLGAFARGWWKDDDQAPPADDQEGIPAFLRRTA